MKRQGKENWVGGESKESRWVGRDIMQKAQGESKLTKLQKTYTVKKRMIAEEEK